MPSLLSLLALVTLAQATPNVLDSAHTDISFSVRHMMVSNVKGQFTNFDGNFDFNEKTNELSKVDIKIQADSITTNNAKRDDHLKNDDFLNTKKYPNITFKADKKVKLELNKPVQVPGTLTIRDKTKPVTLTVEYRGSIKDPWGNDRKGFSASTTINRKEFGVNFHKALDSGGVVVADEVKILIEGEAIPKN